MELTTKDKEQICARLKAYVDKYPSQNKAVGSLKSTSAGTVSNILNGKWENISEDMWRRIADQVGTVGGDDAGWQIVETGAYQEITYALDDAQKYKNVTWVVGESGSGKSTLLNCIGALDTPTSGEIRIDGHNLFALKEKARTIFRRRNIGFIFQSFQLDRKSVV